MKAFNRLLVTRFEDRDVPANFSTLGPPLEIPGFTGPTQETVGHADANESLDRAVVALAGGSARVRVVSGEGAVLLDTIVFDPAFRGGGHVEFIPTSTAAWGAGVSDPLYVVPGVGGGPVVAKFTFDSTSGKMQLAATFFAPYPEEFRGGLKVSFGEMTGDEINEVFFLPGDGGGPVLSIVDIQTDQTIAQFFVGEMDDRTGDHEFTEEKGSATLRGQQVVAIQRGNLDPVTLIRAEVRLWNLGGVELVY